jgi:hypothetical protein
MREFQLGEVIAERRTVFEAATVSRSDVTIRIGRPILHIEPPRESWVCPIQIHGVGDGRVMGIFGVDTMQALLLAVHTIPAILGYYVREVGGRFLHHDRVDNSFVSSCRTVLEHSGDTFPADSA